MQKCSGNRFIIHTKLYENIQADEPECKSEQKPEPRTEENSEQNAEPESKENSEDESELAIIAEEAPADITKDNCGIVSNY